MYFQMHIAITCKTLIFWNWIIETICVPLQFYNICYCCNMSSGRRVFCVGSELEIQKWCRQQVSDEIPKLPSQQSCQSFPRNYALGARSNDQIDRLIDMGWFFLAGENHLGVLGVYLAMKVDAFRVLGPRKNCFCQQGVGQERPGSRP